MHCLQQARRSWLCLRIPAGSEFWSSDSEEELLLGAAGSPHLPTVEGELLMLLHGDSCSAAVASHGSCTRQRHPFASCTRNVPLHRHASTLAAPHAWPCAHLAACTCRLCAH